MSTVKRVTVLEPISSQVVYDNTTEAPKLKVAAYARVSTEQDEQQSSYEAQVNYYNPAVHRHPAERGRGSHRRAFTVGHIGG